MDTVDTKNLEFNSTSDPQQEYHYEPPSYFVMLPVALIAITGVMANIVIIYAIAKFPTLHTPTKWYVFNWSIFSAILLALSPPSIVVFASVEFLPIELMCWWQGELLTLFSGNVLFVVLLIFDWYSLNFCAQTTSRTFKRHYRTEIALGWIVVALFSIYVNVSCRYATIYKIFDFVGAGYVVFISVVHVIRVVKIWLGHVVLEKSRIILVLVSSHFLCCFPNFVIICIRQFTNLSVLDELHVLAAGVAYCNPLIVLFLLSVYDESFKDCMRTLCKCKNDEIKLNGTFESVDLQTDQVSTLI